MSKLIVRLMDDEGDAVPNQVESLSDGTIIIKANNWVTMSAQLEDSTNHVGCYFCNANDVVPSDASRIIFDDTGDCDVYACIDCLNKHCFKDTNGIHHYNNDGNYIEVKIWRAGQKDPVYKVFYDLEEFQNYEFDWMEDMVVAACVNFNKQGAFNGRV